MAALCIVLALFGALDGIRGHAVVQQASASLCKGVHPYNSPALNKTQGITMGFHAPTQVPSHTHNLSESLYISLK